MKTAASKLLEQAVRPKVMAPGQLAKRLGVTPQSVSDWIAGKSKPRDELKVQLEELLKIPMQAWAEVAAEDEPGKGDAA